MSTLNVIFIRIFGYNGLRPRVIFTQLRGNNFQYWPQRQSLFVYYIAVINVSQNIWFLFNHRRSATLNVPQIRFRPGLRPGPPGCENEAKIKCLHEGETATLGLHQMGNEMKKVGNRWVNWLCTEWLSVFVTRKWVADLLCSAWN